MVNVNKQDGNITVKIQGDSSDLYMMQKSLIRLLQCFNFDDFGNSSGDTFYQGLNLLESLLPNEKQQKRGLISETNYLELPENLNEKQVNHIREAMKILNNPSLKTVARKNPVHEAITNLAK